jgi:hypothetical protein
VAIAGVLALAASMFLSRRAGRWRWDYELEPASPWRHFSARYKRAQARRRYHDYSPQHGRAQDEARKVRNARRLAGLKPNGDPMGIEPPQLSEGLRDFEGREVR